jgi:hypothetical protein
MFGSLRGFTDAIKATFSLYPDKAALNDLGREVRPVHSYNPLIQIEAHATAQQTEESHA